MPDRNPTDESSSAMAGSSSSEKASLLPHDTNTEDTAHQNSKSETYTDDWVPPPQRKLGYLQDLVNPPTDGRKCTEPLDFHLRKITGLIVSASRRSPHFTEDFIDQLTNIAIGYFSSIISSLHKLTEIQRHSKPGIADLELCLEKYRLAPGDLYPEYQRSLHLPDRLKPQQQKINNQITQCLEDFYADHYELSKDDPSSVFHANEQYEIAALIPQQRRRPSYIPSYLPALPPDYTYQNTGSYMKTYTELKQIKLKLVEESRLNERSLYKLINNGSVTPDGKSGKNVSGSSDQESDNEDIMSVHGANNVSDVESPQDLHFEKDHIEKNDQADGKEGIDGNALNGALAGPSDDAKKDQDTSKDAGTEAPKPEGDALPNDEPKAELPNHLLTFTANGKQNDKAFDFVAYAQKRRLAKERRSEHIAKKKKLRDGNIFLKAERHYSAYATEEPTEGDDSFFTKYLADSYKKVIKATRIAEKKKMIKLNALLEEKRKRDEEQKNKTESFEFGFSFNPNNDLLDDSDEEEEEENLGELDFGDQPPKDEDGSRAGKRPAKAPQTEDHNEENAGEYDSDDEELEDAENELAEALGEPINGSSNDHELGEGDEFPGNGGGDITEREFDSLAGEVAQQTTQGEPPMRPIGLNDHDGADGDESDSDEDDLVDT